MQPAKASSSLFQADSAVCFLNAYDNQKFYFREPNFSFPGNLQESELKAKPPNMFQYVAGNLAFSTSKYGQVEVFDLSKEQLVPTRNTVYYTLYDIVSADVVYLFGRQESDTSIIAYADGVFQLVKTMSGLWEGFAKVQIGDAYVFGGKISKPTAGGIAENYVGDLYRLEHNAIERIEISSVGVPCPRARAVALRLNARLFCVFDGESHGGELNDMWIFDQQQAMFMEINRSALKIQPINGEYLQWRQGGALDVVSTLQRDQAICSFGFPQRFEEMDFIRADRAEILRRCISEGLV